MEWQLAGEDLDPVSSRLGILESRLDPVLAGLAGFQPLPFPSLKEAPEDPVKGSGRPCTRLRRTGRFGILMPF